ncbi:hypothetical protein [Amycolatopsis circi]|uniref:hypothetical protein n=1 Tax=Amycolatopsis circi TaxID=871959 RepID=UPI0013BEA50B|nr:hypothetical protein [Amycolatopsis circi]
MSEAIAEGPDFRGSTARNGGADVGRPRAKTAASNKTACLQRWIARLLMITAAPGILPSHLWSAPLRDAESRYLADNGVPERYRELIFRATRCQTRMTFIGLLTVVVAVVLLEVVLVLPVQFPAMPPFLVGRDGSFVAGTFLAFLSMWVLSLLNGSPRRRLMVSVGRAARLVLLLDPRAEQSWRGRVLQSYLAEPRVRRRHVEGVAWALTRDTAILTGQDAAAGMTVGELLLWFAENPADRRRRPVLGIYVAELAAAAAGGYSIPHAQFMPAARFRTRSPREPALRRLRSFVGGALATGIVVAIVTAVLRLWFK